MPAAPASAPVSSRRRARDSVTPIVCQPPASVVVRDLPPALVTLCTPDNFRATHRGAAAAWRGAAAARDDI